MVSWISSFVEIFRGEKCEKMIKYDGRILTIKGLKVSVPSVPIDIGEIETKFEKIREASEVAITLDDYQFAMCKICKGLGKDDPEWRKYNELRISSLQLMTTFRLVLIALKEDPQTKKLELDNIVERMKDTLNINKQSLPAIDDGETEVVSKTEVQTVNPEAVSKAKAIADLSDKDLDVFFQKIQEDKTESSIPKTESYVNRAGSLIYEAKEQYEKSSIKGLTYETIYRKIQPIIKELYLHKEYKEIIGDRNADELSRLLANQRANLDEFNDASNLGIQSIMDEARRKIIFTFNRIISKLDDIEISLV